MQDNASKSPETHQLSRRKWLSAAMVASLAAAYGTLTTFALRFIFPERLTGPPQRVFLGFTRDLGVGESRAVRLPSGDQLLLSNSGQIDPVTGSVFLAFSNRCPHLGCKVHWESQESRFYCPCHQGVFDPAGRATSGPPADSGKNLKPYRLEIKGQSIYVLLERV